MAGATPTMREMLRGLPVFPAELPEFDVRSAPGDPVTLFLTWLADAVRDKVLGPQAMTLATADAAGRVSSRVLICRDVDKAGRWYFESNAVSVKGRSLAANPRAAASFYWPQHGRQIRITGEAASAGREASAADFLAKPPASRAATLVGHQSDPLDDLADLDEAFRRAQAEVEANPSLVDPDSTLYALTADTVEFWQGDQRRRHRRLQYQRGAGTWTSRLLWPLLGGRRDGPKSRTRPVGKTDKARQRPNRNGFTGTQLTTGKDVSPDQCHFTSFWSGGKEERRESSGFALLPAYRGDEGHVRQDPGRGRPVVVF